MKTIQHFSILAALTLTLALLASTSLDAQTLTETLQKEIWSIQTPMNADEWTNRLPAANLDTLFQTDGTTAELLQTDDAGLPTTVVLLAREGHVWVPQTRTSARWDANGRLISLESYHFEQGLWANESLTNVHFDANGDALRLDFLHWEEGRWTLSYVNEFSKPAPMLGLR